MEAKEKNSRKKRQLTDEHKKNLRRAKLACDETKQVMGKAILEIIAVAKKNDDAKLDEYLRRYSTEILDDASFN